MSTSPQSRSPEQMALWDEVLQTELRLTAALGRRPRAVSGVLPSGSLIVDAMLRIGGMPRAQLVELFGPPGAGKTTLSLHFLAAAQAAGQTAALIDAESSFDPGYAQSLGVAVDRLVVIRAADGEQALRIVDKLAASAAVDAIVLDSVAALVSPEELAQPLEDGAIPFAHGELVANGLQRISRSLARSPASLLFLNQLRTYQGIGCTETSTGGWGLKLHAAIRLELRELSRRPGGGHRASLRVVKNQFAPLARGELEFGPAGAIDPAAEAVRLGLRYGLLLRREGELLFEGEPLGDPGGPAGQRLAGAVRAYTAEAARKGVSRATEASRMVRRPGSSRSALPG